MRKRLILIMALALVAGLAVAAYAEVQNVKVGGDLDLMAVTRQNLALRDDPKGMATTNPTTGYSGGINALITIARVRLDADLTDNVSTTVRLLNERVWGNNRTQNTTAINDDHILLDLASVTLKEFLYSPLTITVGRQELRYGNGLIIGRPYTNGVSQGHGLDRKEGLPDSLDDLSSRRSFDAVKVNLNYDPLVCDLVYARMITPNVEMKNSTHLWGANISYSGLKDVLLEGYFWQRLRDARVLSAVNNAREDLNNIGGRIAYNGIKDLSLGLEGAYQFGKHIRNTTLYPNDYANDNEHRSVRALAFQLIGNYTFSAVKMTPSIGASYTYLSGGRYKQDTRYFRAWDGMYEDQGSGTLYNKILGFSNVQLVNLNASAKLLDDLKLTGNYYYLRLNEEFPDQNVGAVNLGNVVLSGVAGDPAYEVRSGKMLLGQEFDLELAYDYTEDVQLLLSGATFLPGGVFNKEVNKKTAKQVIGSMKVTF